MIALIELSSSRHTEIGILVDSARGKGAYASAVPCRIHSVVCRSRMRCTRCTRPRLSVPSLASGLGWVPTERVERDGRKSPPTDCAAVMWWRVQSVMLAVPGHGGLILDRDSRVNRVTMASEGTPMQRYAILLSSQTLTEYSVYVWV